MTVAEWLAAAPVEVATVTTDASLEDAVDRMLALAGSRSVFVTDDDGRLVGYLPHRRLAALLLAEFRRSHSPRHLSERIHGGHIHELMHRPHPVGADADLAHALHHLLDLGDEDLPVIDADRRLVGVINLTAVLRAFRAGRL
ncbi:CBS domain-containing protein [Haliangium sp.]|uniref:CBS domain-containing protein n=1 Tax=Haliangium sp. TaxID=2663208 RepID=UPI003D133BFB